METISIRNPRDGKFDYEFRVPEHEALVERAAALRAGSAPGARARSNSGKCTTSGR